MDQTKQASAKFVGFKQRYKKAGDNRPDFSGQIGVPGSDKIFRHALWAGKDKNGRVMFTGQTQDVAANASALEQVEAMAGGIDAKMLEDGNLKLRPGQIVLFTNSFRDEQHPNRPTYYGRWNDGEKIVNVSAWLRESRTGEAILTGQVQLPQPGKKASEMGMEQMNEQDLEAVANETTTERPRRRSSR